MENRIEALEVKVSFQEHLLGELDDVIRALRGEIDTLRRDLGDARAQLDKLNPDPENEPPPHY